MCSFEDFSPSHTTFGFSIKIFPKMCVVIMSQTYKTCVGNYALKYALKMHVSCNEERGLRLFFFERAHKQESCVSAVVIACLWCGFPAALHLRLHYSTVTQVKLHEYERFLEIVF